MKKLFHKEVDQRMQIGRDFTRAGKVYKPPPHETIPVIQIAAPTLKDFDVKKQRKERLYEAIFSKNKLKKKAQKKFMSKLQNLKKEVLIVKSTPRNKEQDDRSED